MDPKQIFDSFKQHNVMIIGDVMIDTYLWGDVSRISPEAPVPVVAAVKRENRLGGAANVALNIRALGSAPILCTVTGDDDHRKIFEKLIKKRKLIDDGIVYCTKRKTTVKTRIISHNQQLLRIDEEESQPVSDDITEALLKRIKILLSGYNIDAIVFEDYDKGVITSQLISEVVSLATDRGIPTLVDPKKRNFADYKGVSFFKPNFKEFKEGLKLDLSKEDKEAFVNAAEKFRSENNIRMLMITLAEKGMFVSHSDSYSFIPAEIRNISDVSGAGDAVISVSALGLAAGLPVDVVARISNIAGGLVCETPGVTPVDREQLINECRDKNIFKPYN